MSHFGRLTSLLALAAVGCEPEIQYTVTNVYTRNGQLYQQKCPLTPGGRVDINDPNLPCHEEPIMAAPATPPASATPTSVAVPASADLAAALVKFFNSTQVHSDVDMCRQQYANGIKLFRAKITVESSGDVTAAEPLDHTNQWFEGCAVKALRAAKAPPFTGTGPSTAVTSEVVLAF